MTAAVVDQGRARLPPVTRRHVRAAVGALWLLDAGLQAQPHLFGAQWWHDHLAQSVMGQPQPVSRSILWIVDVVAAHPAAWNATFVAVQAVLGFCLLAGRFERVAIAASVPWALGIWWVGEGFGLLPTGFATLAAGAPGPVLYYPLLGLLAWPRPAERAGPHGRRVPFLPAAALWIGVWAGGSLLELPWRFPPGRVLQADIEEAGAGQPAWLAAMSRHLYTFVGDHAVLIPVVLGLAQCCVALGVLHSSTRRAAIAAGVAITLLYWVAVQGLGAVPGGGATDPGAGPLLVLLGAALWPYRSWPHPGARRASGRPAWNVERSETMMAGRGAATREDERPARRAVARRSGWRVPVAVREQRRAEPSER